MSQMDRQKFQHRPKKGPADPQGLYPNQKPILLA